MVTALLKLPGACPWLCCFVSWAGKVQLVLDLYAVTEERGTAYRELEMSTVPSHFLGL